MRAAIVIAILILSGCSSSAMVFGRAKAAYIACEPHGGVSVRDDRHGQVICNDEAWLQYAPPNPHSKTKKGDNRAIRGATRINR